MEKKGWNRKLECFLHFSFPIDEQWMIEQLKNTGEWV